MKQLTILVVALLAGCMATTPKELIALGDRLEFSSKQGVEAVSACIAQNADKTNYVWRGIIQNGNAPNTREVIVKSETSPILIALVQVEPASSGSRMVMYYRGPITPSPALGIKELMQGC